MYNCLERYGVNKTAKYCVDSLSSNADSKLFAYPLKNKYNCLGNPSNEFPQVSLPDEVGVCLNKYFDNKVETCLSEYEEKYGGNMGFNGKKFDEREVVKPANDDPFSYLSSYWSLYTNLTEPKQLQIGNMVFD